mmetsp:Transcript_23822/g.49856  ORF Transcript_23822/g.49856 Transcript_23822/m.49856 type:complete len:235 (+) Transcript_23822:308-1012(+)
MEKWARRYGRSQVQFLMVCVESAGVALQFGRMFDLQGVVNSFIPSRGYMPVGFGQLGCSGFVISDPHGYFVSRKTRAYLQHGENAWSHVEELLHRNFGILPLPPQRSPKRKKAEEKKEVTENEDILSPNWVLPSVGVTSMDNEHEECEEALALLLRHPDVEALTKVMELLTEHFQHEESLMKASGFGSPGEKFSPYANHVKDHERILDIGFAELAKHQQPNSSIPEMTCSEASA